MKIVALLAVAFGVTLSACGNDTKIIKDVKHRPITDKLTYSQAFEGNTYCKDNKWTIDEDEKRRTLVIHTCKIKIDSENIAAFVDESFSRLDQHAVIREANIRNMYERTGNLEVLLRDVNPNSPGYDPNSSFITTRLEQLETRYEVQSYEQATALLEEYRSELNHDINAIPDLYAKFKAQKVAALPKSMELTRSIVIALLPNGKDEWYKPEFVDISTGVTFHSNGQDITSTTNSDPQQTYNFIIAKVYPSSNSTKGFREFIDTLCKDDICPLLSQFYEVEDI